MINIKQFQESQTDMIVSWNEGLGEDFLRQWSGNGFTYPITREQIINDTRNRVARYMIDREGELIGTIAIMHYDPKTGSAHIGHFILDPRVRGNGYGMEAIREFVKLCFGILKLKELTLRVYAYNQAAVQCYVKNGFQIVERYQENGGADALLMSLRCEKTVSSDHTEIEICSETEADYENTELMTQHAFWNLHVPGCDEHLLVTNLRKSADYLPRISRIARLNGQVVGVIMYSRAYIVTPDGKREEVLSFGPLSVEPEYQSLGIGGKLLKATIELARQAGYRAIVIFGEPDYYPRFGFKTCDHYGITTPDGKNFNAFMAYELQTDALAGISGKFYESEVFEHLPKEDVERMDQKFPELVKLHLPGQWHQ